MNNEPVAWMLVTGHGTKILEKKPYCEVDYWKPLYTHPVKCNKCNDTEWVCENHPNQEAHKCIHCGGAGMPCECTHTVNTCKHGVDDGACKECYLEVTHPAELTDEEMLECAEGAGCVFDYSYKGEVTFISRNALKRFVLAILRKASEK